MRILLTEDDPMLGKAIKDVLENDGHVVDWMMDAEMCEAALATTNFEILLLDLNLPKKSGLEVLKNLRAKKNSIPILILTARDSISQRIAGLDLGADDYLVKPFDLEELLARIRSLVRRSKGISSPVIIYGNIELDIAGHKITKDGIIIDMSPKEFAIIKFLLENTGKVISKSTLESLIYSWNNNSESNTIEVNIHHLRKKLGSSLIKTVWGMGYIIEKNAR
jgi:two-component system response regulator QseB